MEETFNTSPKGGMPKNWLVESILATLFCCLPFGIVGIIFASKVNSAYNSGDFLGAEQASRDAAKWTKIAFYVGLGAIALNIILFFMGAGALMFLKH